MSAWDDAERQLRDKVKRIRRARASHSSLWRTAAYVGALGWLFVLPVVLGALGGHWLARRTGSRWPAVAGLLLGLGIGGYGMWRTVARSLAEDRRDRDEEGET